jgi:hypothetical protein
MFSNGYSAENERIILSARPVLMPQVLFFADMRQPHNTIQYLDHESQ